MKAVPRRLVVLGGGPAGVELAQVVRRLGGEVALVESAERVLVHEPGSLGEALADALRRDGLELLLGVQAAAARREDEDYVLELSDGRQVRGDRLLVATGRRPRVAGIGLETVGVNADARGIPVDDHLRAGERLWAIGDVNGIWPLTHVGEYEGEIVAANILGEPRAANYEAVPRVHITDPQAAAVGAAEAPFDATAPIAKVSRTATYTHAYAESNGFLTLLSDGERLTGAYALGPRRASGSSKQHSRSALASRSRCSTTRSSRSRASQRSTPMRSKCCATRSKPRASQLKQGDVKSACDELVRTRLRATRPTLSAASGIKVGRVRHSAENHRDRGSQPRTSRARDPAGTRLRRPSDRR